MVDVSSDTVVSSLNIYSSQMRALKLRAADTINVKDFGAAGTGSADDLTAINFALAAGEDNASIPINTITWSAGQATATVLPPYTFGNNTGSVFTISTALPSAYNGTFIALSGTSSTVLVFALASDPGPSTMGGYVVGGGRVIFPSGMRYNASAAPNWSGANVVELNGATDQQTGSIANGFTDFDGQPAGAKDLLKTILNGGEYWIRGASTPQLTPALRIDHNQTMDLLGNSGGLGTILNINGELQQGSTQTALWGASIQITVLGFNSGDSVGINTSMVKTAGSKSGVTASNPTVSDQSNGPSSISGYMTGEEIDVTGLGLDDGGNYADGTGDLPDGSGIRTGLMVVGRGMSETIGLGPTEFGWGVRVGAGRYWQNAVPQSTYMKRPFSFHGVYSVAAFDASLAVPLAGSNAAAFAMAADATFGLDAIPAAAQLGPVHDFTWNSAANEFQLRGNQLPYFGVNGNTGAISITGPITGNGFGVDNSGNISGGNLLLAGALSSSACTVAGVTIVNGGLWTEIPTLTISPSPAGATAEASVASMVASGGSISIATTGSGYVPGDIVTLVGGTGTQPTYTIATVQVTPGLTAATMGGSGYTIGDIVYLAATPYVWAKEYPYSLNTVIQPSPTWLADHTATNCNYQLTVLASPFISGITEPNWTNDVGSTISDGGCTWQVVAQECATPTAQVPFFIVLNSVSGLPTIASGGENFAEGDKVVLSGGSINGYTGTDAEFVVTSIGTGGVVTGLMVASPAAPGLITYDVTNPVSFSAKSPSLGTGLTLNVTIEMVIAVTETGNMSYISGAEYYGLSGGSGTGLTAPLTFMPNSLALLSSGSMTALPTFPASFDTTTGSGSGLTATVGFAINEVNVSSEGSGYSPVPADVTTSSVGLVQPASLTTTMSAASSIPVQISSGLSVTGTTTLSAVTATSLNDAIIGGSTPAAATFTTLTAATLTSTGTTSLGATTASSINGTQIGNTTPAAGKFTTLSASGGSSLAGVTATSLDGAIIGGSTPAAATFTSLTAATLTSTGTTSLGATTASSINGTQIGNTTPAAGKFTTLSASGGSLLAGVTATSLDGATIGSSTPAAATFTTLTAATLTSTGTTSLGATTASSINGTQIGNTTPAAGKFTTLSASGGSSLAGVTATSLDGATIGSSTPAAATFTSLTAATLTSTGTTSLGATTASSINSTPVGITTPSTGKFTALSVNGNIGLNESGNLASILLRTPANAANELYYSAAAASAWTPDTAYLMGAVVVPMTTPNGFNYICTVAGTSGAAQPTWPTAPNSTVTDGGSSPQLKWQINYPDYLGAGIDGPVLRGNSGGVLATSYGIALQWNASAVSITPNLVINGLQILTNRVSVSVSTGFNYYVPIGTSVVQFMPSAAILAGEAHFPIDEVDGQLITFTTIYTITNFTLIGSSGQTIYGSPGTLTPGAPCTFVFDYVSSSWIRLG